MPLFVGDIVQASIVGRCYNQRILFTMMYRVAQAGPPEQTAALQLGLFLTAWTGAAGADISARYRECLSGDYTSLSARAQVVKPVRSSYVNMEMVALGQGGAGTVANDAAAITLRTANAGRNQVATKHIGPIPDAVSISGVLTNDYRDTLISLAAQLTVPVAVGAGGLIVEPIIYHKATNTFDRVTTFVIGEQSRVQRRRTVGLGI